MESEYPNLDAPVPPRPPTVTSADATSISDRTNLDQCLLAGAGFMLGSRYPISQFLQLGKLRLKCRETLAQSGETIQRAIKDNHSLPQENCWVTKVSAIREGTIGT